MTIKEMNKEVKKPIIIYPCRWLYKVVGTDETEMRWAIQDTMKDRKHQVSLSRRSKEGKYHCLNLETEVADEQDRNKIYAALGNHACIKTIL